MTHLANKSLTPEQQKLVFLWQEHMRCEFDTSDLDGTMATMADESHLLNVPVLSGGEGLAAIKAFYGTYFIPQIPDDFENVLVSRTVGDTQIVDELILKFTHSVKMDWMLPGIEPTHKRVEVPLIVIIGFKEDKVAYEHIYWDQACVLVQVGLLDADTLPVTGIESAKKLSNPLAIEANKLIRKHYQE